jgi:2,4-dienoyl-CoA reductase-like NADH-dependent reductase (Old Yellow Enzyme family)
MKDLFSETTIGPLTLRNHFVRSATWEGMAGEDGTVTDKLIELYRNLARGGIGLIITSYTYVDYQGKASPGMLGADRDELIGGLRKLADAVHSEGALIVLQLAHGGSQTKYDTGLPKVGPSAVAERSTGVVPEELTKEGIKGLVEKFTNAAIRACKANFDGVQLHAAHGYLLSQFLSSYSNRRTDEYGGSIEKRARLIFEIYRSIRQASGDDFAILIKINCSDFDEEGGFTPEESLWVCQKLSEMGIDAIELSGGIPAAGPLSPARTKINTPEAEAYFREYAQQFRPHLKCPLILVGGIRSLETCEELYRTGVADFFSMARPLISEPNLIKRWQEGDTRRARCISCNRCFRAGIKGNLYCVNFEEKEK